MNFKPCYKTFIMSLVEFFFNPDYRESLNRSTSVTKKFSFKDELNEGDMVKCGVFTVLVDEVNDGNFYGVIVEQDEKNSMFYPNHTNYKGTRHKFTNYDNVL